MAQNESTNNSEVKGQLPDEIVMLGGHYDSWHGGTGAVDNASGSAVTVGGASTAVIPK